MNSPLGRFACAAALLVFVLPLAVSAQREKTTRRKPLLSIPEVTRDEVICFALYTVHAGTLKLTAQLYPLAADEDRTVRLEIEEDGEWREVARTEVLEAGWTAPFRVEGWDASRTARYRVGHGEAAFYTGTIQRDPTEKPVITVFAFTGNSISPSHGGDIARDDIVANIKRLKPDLLFFSGDQVYDHHKHYAAWLKFGRDFGDAIRDVPTITIPDDHDVGQANLWGAAGKISKMRTGPDGGYAAPLEYVKEVERAQTSHLPDPYDPTPVQRGIGVYYTSLTLGGIDFAILEDRKFKTGPKGFVPKQGPRPDHITDPAYDPKSIDLPEAVLLGDRQLRFLREWAADWRGAEMKCVLSQTIFCGGAHIHGKTGNRLHADLDSNGWPQAGRNRALAEMRRAFAFHLAGDQHLATIFSHGINDWNDAGYSFCVPSIANLYLRWWRPLEPGTHREEGAPDHTGRFLDGFGNKITCWAVANPEPEPSGGLLNTRAAGFGIVKFDKRTRRITMECWPRNVDVTDPAASQYPGWPRTIEQQDNYGRAAIGWLPTLEVSGVQDPVVQIIDEQDGELVYALRIKGTTFRPKVFRLGSYTVKVGEQRPANMKTFEGVRTLGGNETKTLAVTFD